MGRNDRRGARAAYDWPFGRPLGAARFFAAWRDDDGQQEEPRRMAGLPERWRLESETFEGAAVLQDLEHARSETEAAQILGRYCTLRVWLLARSNIAVAELELERSAAAPYAQRAQELCGAERSHAAKLLALAGHGDSALACETLLAEGESAWRAGQPAGAFVCLRAAATMLARLARAHTDAEEAPAEL